MSWASRWTVARRGQSSSRFAAWAPGGPRAPHHVLVPPDEEAAEERDFAVETGFVGAELLARSVLMASVPIRSQNCFQKRHWTTFVLEVEAAPAFAAAVTTLRRNAVNHALSTGRSSSPPRRDDRKVSSASGEVSDYDANCAACGGRSSARR